MMESESTIKEKKIKTAVSFLQNPKVRNTSLERKRAFLVKKGLTEEEIDQAVELSGTVNNEVVQSQLTEPPKQSLVQPGVVTVQGLWKNYLLVSVLGGTVGYGIVHLLKTYFLPWIFKSRNGDTDLQLEKIDRSVLELKENMLLTVGNVQTTMSSVQKLLEEQQKQIQTLATDLSSTKSKLSLMSSEKGNLTEVKSELSTLKGLLLGRRQFPSPSLPSSPAIPAWQRSAAAAESSTPSQGDPKQDVPKQDAPNMNDPKYDVPKMDDTILDETSQDVPKTDDLKLNDSKPDGVPKMEVSIQVDPKQDVSKQDVPKLDGSILDDSAESLVQHKEAEEEIEEKKDNCCHTDNSLNMSAEVPPENGY